MIYNFKKPILFKYDIFKDNRGDFAELFNQKRYNYLKKIKFKQINVVDSKKNVLRGMHFQIKRPIGYLLSILDGKIIDVSIDLRQKSQYFKKTYKYELNRGDQLFIPPGFGHGYFCKSKNSKVTYFCTDTYDPEDENGFNYNDPIIKNLWPKKLFLIKKRDNLFKLLNDIKLSKLPQI